MSSSRPAQTHARSPGDRLLGIEAGRGIAALLVLGHHFRDHLYGNFHTPVPVADFFTFGHAGVDFFFVLSGFIICHVHARDIGRPDRLLHYWQRRFTRIYPFYWIILGGAILGLAASVHHALPSGWDMLSSMLLLPTPTWPIVGTAWTLQHELVFYSLFCVLILNRRLGTVALAAWFLLILVAPGQGPILGSFNIDFLLGMGAAWLLGRTTVPAARSLFLLGFVIFLGSGLTENVGIAPLYSSAPHLGFAAGSTLMILGLVELERAGRLAVPALLTVLGGASYAIYLSHFLVLGAIWAVLARLHIEAVLPVWLEFLVLFAIVAWIGVLISWTLEQPAIRLTRAVLAGLGGRRAGSAPAGIPGLISPRPEPTARPGLH